MAKPAFSLLKAPQTIYWFFLKREIRRIMYQLNRKSDNPITVMKLKHWAWQILWLQTTTRKCKRVVAHPQTHIPRDMTPGTMKLLKGTVMESQRLKFYYLFIIVILNNITYLKDQQWPVAAEGVLFQLCSPIELSDHRDLYINEIIIYCAR